MNKKDPLKWKTTCHTDPSWKTNNFDVYDRVWVMKDNKPKEMIVFAVVLSASDNKCGQDVHYKLVKSMVGTGWGNHEGQQYSEDNMFCTKQDLVDSL